MMVWWAQKGRGWLCLSLDDWGAQFRFLEVRP